MSRPYKHRFALVLGLVFGNESPKPLIAVAFPILLAGLGFMLYGERLAGWFKRRRAGSSSGNADGSAGPA